MNTKTIVLFILLSVANAAAAAPLPPNELHRLASYLSYITVGMDSQKPDGGSIYTVGSNCPECLGKGEVGDGRTMLPCGWEDGKFYCNKGIIAKRSTGDVMDACCVGCALCETANDELTEEEADELTEQLEESGGFTEEARQFAEAIEDATEDWTEPDILCFKGSAWTFENKRVRQATNADMVKHLVDVHGLDFDSVSKYSREELIAQHNLLHNSEVRAAAPSSSCPDGQCPTTSNSSSGSSCPSGNCPTSSSSSSSRRGLFGRRR